MGRTNVGTAQIGSSSPPRVILVRYRNQEIKNLKVTDLDGNVLPIATSFEQGAMIVRVSRPIPHKLRSEIAFVIEYIVAGVSADVIRIPLAVPEARSSFGDLPVHITVTVPEGEGPLHDTFPALTKLGGKYVSAKLEDVPSVVMVHRTSRSPTFVGRVFTLSRVSDAIMIALVILGSYLWFVRSRPKASRRSGDVAPMSENK